jgi:hypothetical protein
MNKLRGMVLITVGLCLILISLSANGTDPVELIYVYSQQINVPLGGSSLSSGTYNGLPVVIYHANQLKIYSMYILANTTELVNMSISSATLTDVTIYAANITATVPLLGTVIITPQNANLFGLLVGLVTSMSNVKIYAYYMNMSSFSYSSLRITIK